MGYIRFCLGVNIFYFQKVKRRSQTIRMTLMSLMMMKLDHQLSRSLWPRQAMLLQWHNLGSLLWLEHQ